MIVPAVKNLTNGHAVELQEAMAKFRVGVAKAGKKKTRHLRIFGGRPGFLLSCP